MNEIRESHRAAIVEMLDASGVIKQFESTQESMIQVQVQTNLAIQENEHVFRAWASKYLSFESMKDSFVVAYADHFSENEAHAITAFWRSSIGQKVCETMPKMAERLVAEGAARAMNHASDFYRMLAEAKSPRLS